MLMVITLTLLMVNKMAMHGFRVIPKAWFGLIVSKKKIQMKDAPPTKGG